MSANAKHPGHVLARIPAFAWAYALAAVVAVVAWTLPAAIVTTSPGQLVQETEATKLSQELVLISLLIAVGGRSVRVLRPLALALAMLLALLGGALGAFGTEVLIEMNDFEASGRAGSGAGVVGLAGLTTVVAIALDVAHGIRHRRPRGPGVRSAAVTIAAFGLTFLVGGSIIRGSLGAGATLVAAIGVALVAWYVDRYAQHRDSSGAAGRPSALPHAGEGTNDGR